VFIVGAAISGILGDAITSGPLGDLSQLLNPVVPIDGSRDLLVGDTIFDSPVSRTGFPRYVFGLEWLAIVLVGGAAVMWRYRRLAA
jgi:hypothetical protein